MEKDLLQSKRGKKFVFNVILTSSNHAINYIIFYMKIIKVNINLKTGSWLNEQQVVKKLVAYYPIVM